MILDTKEKCSEYVKDIFRKHSDKYRIFLFRGDLGAGKTYYISQIINMYRKGEYVNSPTYTILNAYDDIEPHFFHADLYRLENEEELFETGIMDIISENGFFLMEWPDRFMDILNTFPHILINIKEGKKEEEREVDTIEHTIY